MPAKMMKLMPLPMPRSVMSSPIHIRATAPAVSVAIWVSVSKLPRSNAPVRTPLRVEEGQEPVGLEHRHRDRQVARVLGDLVPPVLTLAAERLQRRDDALHQLHDDRRVDVRVHAQRDDREVRQAAAREQVQQPEQRVARRGTRRAASGRCPAPARRPGTGRRSAGRGRPGSGAGCPAPGRRSAGIRTRGSGVVAGRRRRRLASSAVSASESVFASRRQRRPRPRRRRRSASAVGLRSAAPRPSAAARSTSARLGGAARRRRPIASPRPRRRRVGRLGRRCVDADRLDAASVGTSRTDTVPPAASIFVRADARERVGHDEQRRAQLAGAEDLERLVEAADEPDGAQDVLVDRDLGAALRLALAVGAWVSSAPRSTAASMSPTFTTS